MKSAVIGIDKNSENSTKYWRSRHVSVKIKIGDPRNIFFKRLGVAIAIFLLQIM
ncbi:hypothetical protein HC931_27440 [Candidatus Gracilibacteria bacterium]|nr:hypothetical protein [Candidatus Gracilibacteria bacterium]NJM88167.1 hypothetical protein [Hydrococcus sp. RU_2_2]NJQ97057.1 hypothetical protein [Hydrococcus sp. CSU_1_8]